MEILPFHKTRRKKTEHIYKKRVVSVKGKVPVLVHSPRVGNKFQGRFQYSCILQRLGTNSKGGSSTCAFSKGWEQVPREVPCTLAFSKGWEQVPREVPVLLHSPRVRNNFRLMQSVKILCVPWIRHIILPLRRLTLGCPIPQENEEIVREPSPTTKTGDQCQCT